MSKPVAWLAGALALLPGACGPGEPSRAASDAVVAASRDGGASWPLLLRHCLSSANCDPMADFGAGAGEASGVAGSVSWHFQARDKVGEGGQDYGARAEVNLFGQRAAGGKAGRPLTIDELPDNLGGARAKRTTVSIEYRAPSEELEPYFLQFISPHITQVQDPDGAVRLEIIGADGVLFAEEAAGMDAPETPVNGGYKAPDAMIFHVARNIRDEPLPQLMAAIARGESLSLRLVAADGEVLLRDALYTDGYGSALAQAGQAASDPELARTIAERCARFAGEDDEFWKVANVTPALMVCDPRLPELRR